MVYLLTLPLMMPYGHAACRNARLHPGARPGKLLMPPLMLPYGHAEESRACITCPNRLTPSYQRKRRRMLTISAMASDKNTFPLHYFAWGCFHHFACAASLRLPN